MTQSGLRAAMLVALVLVVALLGGCTGEGTPVNQEVASIFFETTEVPAAGAGQFYNEVIVFGTTGGAAPPDRFELAAGNLPVGVSLVPDTGVDLNGNPDPAGAPTGNARLLGFPRQEGSYNFDVKAISTGALGGTAQSGGGDPNLAAQETFSVNVGEGAVNIITPTAQAGTSDPLVPAFFDVVAFVNPANPQAFFSFKFLVAGGTGNNVTNVMIPRELELSVFDANVVNGIDVLEFDTDETPGSGNKFKVDFSDGGVFVLQAGSDVQIGGFPSPRGVVGKIANYAGGAGLDPDWFQRTPAQNGPALNSRRAITDNLPGGDASLGTPQPINFSDYFDPRYEGTWPDFTAPGSQPDLKRRKYPFTAAEYQNAFFLPFTDGVDITPLRFNLIVEAIDTRGTNDTRDDDIIARKSFHAQILIPDIKIDSIFLPAGTSGVDYNEFVNGSGGVPPLQFDLEGVDGTLDLDVTPGDPLTKDVFGIELFDLDGKSAQFVGVPRAASISAGALELTIRIFAAVMNPVQNGEAYISTTPGEGDGKHPVTGKKGTHKTYQVAFGEPSLPALSNPTIVAGRDGVGYPGDTLVGIGGVAQLIPDPVGFVGTYPPNPKRTYEWNSTYTKDASHGPDEGEVVPGLPNGLVLDGGRMSVTNGQISGTPMDRGFHPVTFEQQDSYVRDSASPVGPNQTVFTGRALSISPDTAVYLRGNQGSGGTKSGLLANGTEQIAESRMVPLFLSVSLYSVNTGTNPVRSDCLSDNVDILPVIIPHGGNDSHNDKSIPSVSGVWPAEAGSEPEWGRSTDRAWRHWQQEFTWVQDPSPNQRRIFAYASTKTKKWVSGATSGADSKRYQVYSTTGNHGIFITEPDTGLFWRVAEFNNADTTFGTHFGSEYVSGTMGYASDSYAYSANGVNYTKYWRGQLNDTQMDREVHNSGTGSFIESGSYSSSSGWYKVGQGRTATSIAMSHNGEWCATALPGGSNGKILIWKTTRSADTSGDGVNDPDPIPAALLAQSYITGVQGRDWDGNDLDNAAAVVDIAAVTQVNLLPDSLKFVDGGLLFLEARNLDTIHGFDLVSGDLETKSVNTRTTPNGAGPSATDDNGFYIPDTDKMPGYILEPSHNAQYAFAGNKPAVGSWGSDMIAFTVGSGRNFYTAGDLTGVPRDGFSQNGNRNRALCSMKIATDGGGGLDLAGSTITDLTGSSSNVYGDFLTPGRPGEHADYLTMSDDGKYVAVVRDTNTSERASAFSFYVPTFGNGSTSSSFAATHDAVIATTDSSVDMDSGKTGTQNVLFIGTRSFSGNTTSDPSMPTYATSRHVINSRWRSVRGLFFGKDSKDLIFNYASDDRYPPNYYGSTNGWGINPEFSTSSTFAFGSQQTVRVEFRDASDGAINFDTGSMSGFASNLLAGETGIGGVGDTTPPFGDTDGTSAHQFAASFKSFNGDFLYYVIDGIGSRHFMVGFNITGADITSPEGKVRKPFDPFYPHSSSIGFQQLDTINLPYESRFAAVPGGKTFLGTGESGEGILFVIASDPTSSSSATNAASLELYAMWADRGGDMHVLSSDVTTHPTTNNINSLYPSMSGNVVAFLVNQTASSSRTDRSGLTARNRLAACTNVHAVLQSNGATAPVSFFIGPEASHGSTMAFVGDGNALAGPQAIVFSRADSSLGSNSSWDDRTLRLALLSPGAAVETLDSVQSHYAVLAASRKLDDDPNTPD